MLLEKLQKLRTKYFLGILNFLMRLFFFFDIVNVVLNFILKVI